MDVGKTSGGVGGKSNSSPVNAPRLGLPRDYTNLRIVTFLLENEQGVHLLVRSPALPAFYKSVPMHRTLPLRKE